MMLDPLILLAIGSLVVVGSILVLRLHAFVALLLAAIVVAALTPSDTTIGSRLAEGFGRTCGQIGLLIALASIIGKSLLDSGGADRIVRSALHLFGMARAQLAFLASGFLVGIPVYFDTVFYLLVPLGKAMGTRYPRNYLLYILTIVAGASMAHSLVPPTPGPLAVADLLKVDVGMMMLFGMVVGTFATLAGYAYALWANHRWPIPLRETADISLDELQQLADKDEGELPPFWLAILPIALPMLLIGAQAAVKAVHPEAPPERWHSVWRIVTELGDKNVAVGLGAVIALGTLMIQKRASPKELASAMQAALSSAGVIILITAAGGMFGRILEQTGVGDRIQEVSTTYRIAVLPLAFGVTALIRTAQGSATVAMLTAGGILAGFATNPAALGFHPVYLALAIGCGSKPFPWMNDSGFWLISRAAGLTETETLKTSSTMIAVMGCAGFVVVLVMAKLFPMAVS